MAFTCPRCGTTSYLSQDEKEGFCAACDAFTGGERMRMARLPDLTVQELVELRISLRARRQALEAVQRMATVDATKRVMQEHITVNLSLETAVEEAITSAR